MASAHGFEISPGGQGAIFALSGKAKQDRRQTFGPWEAELRTGGAHVCVRSADSNLQQTLDSVMEEAHDVAQHLLDMLAVEERNPLIVAEPHDNVVWRSGPNGLKLQATCSLPIVAELTVKAEVRNAAGEVLPDPPYMAPQHHFAYRYYRYSQAAQNVFDAYRNMFLALESLLDYIEPKQPTNGETHWLTKALATAQARGLNLATFAKPGSTDPVQDFVDAHYSAVRCAAFHSKSSTGHALRPGSLSDDATALHQLLAVQTLVDELLKSLFSVTLKSGGFMHAGFEHLLSELDQATTPLLLVSGGECPTVEEIVQEDKVSKQLKRLVVRLFRRFTGAPPSPPGDGFPVTFTGKYRSTPDEWLFVSQVKPKEISFSKVSSLRLIAKPSNDLLLGPIANKMNRTLMRTDLDLRDVSTLLLRVRCILRNAQMAKRGFPR
jgi:hypothetical protein